MFSNHPCKRGGYSFDHKFHIRNCFHIIVSLEGPAQDKREVGTVSLEDATFNAY